MEKSEKIKKAALKGEMDAYRYALKSFDKVTPINPKTEKNRIKSAYKSGERDAYHEAVDLLNDPVAENDDEQSLFYFRRQMKSISVNAENDGYIKAMAAFRNITPSPAVKNILSKTTEVLPNSEKYFLKDTPSSLRTAYLMQTGKSLNIKGQFIAQNYQNILNMTKSVVDDLDHNYQLTFKAFQSYATILFIFLEEYDTDIYSNKLTNVRSLIQKSYQSWPMLKLWTMGRLIGYNDKIDYNVGQEVQSSPKVSSSVVTPTNDKVEILSMVFTERLPDTGQPVYEDSDRDAAKLVATNIKAVYNSLSGNDVADQIATKADLYRNLVELRPILDDIISKTSDILASSKPPQMPTLKEIRQVIKYIEALRDNKFMSPELVAPLDLIVKALEPAEQYMGFSLSSLAHRIGGIFTGGTSRAIAKIMAGLKQVDIVYRRVWAAVHSGKMITGQQLS